MLFRRLGIGAFALCLAAPDLFAQFAHTQGKEIVDASGKPLVLRGTGLGNWMVPEGYMWLFEGGPQFRRPSRIQKV
jgi:endoglucanase